MAKIKRVVMIVVDGLGIGAQADSDKYGDKDANTFLHVWEKEKPELPNFSELGLLAAAGVRTDDDAPIGNYGALTEISPGKDTTTGHWELFGLPLDRPFPTYPNGFPADLIQKIEDEIGMGVIGNVAASGTEIIEKLGREHIKTGKPILYTSADSVLQIAAHESIIPPMELWHICRAVRKIMVGEHAVARVIARPFAGTPGAFARTGNRRDFSLDPTGETLLTALKTEGFDVFGIGKIEDIVNGKGLSSSVHPVNNTDCLDNLYEIVAKKRWSGLAVCNLVDTDTLYGHRRDSKGYAQCLEDIDLALPELMPLMGEDTMLIVTADHGCDPTHAGTDHTRERVPLLVWGLGLAEGVALGNRKSFADVSATILEALGAKAKLSGTSFLKEISL